MTGSQDLQKSHYDMPLWSRWVQLWRQRSFYRDYERTFKILPATTKELEAAAHRLRYQVYCRENGWASAENWQKEERDQFEPQSCQYVLLRKGSQIASGVIRLVLPDIHHPLTSFEMQKYCDHPLLQLPGRVIQFCEISRFCFDRSFRRREDDGRLLPTYYEQEMIPDEDGGQVSKAGSLFRRTIPYAPLGLLRAACEVSLQYGTMNILMAPEVTHLSVLKRLGIPYMVLGPALKRGDLEIQPLAFNIKAALDGMECRSPECWEVLTDRGRLSEMATKLQQEVWRDHLLNAEARDAVLQKLL